MTVFGVLLKATQTTDTHLLNSISETSFTSLNDSHTIGRCPVSLNKTSQQTAKYIEEETDCLILAAASRNAKQNVCGAEQSFGSKTLLTSQAWNCSILTDSPVSLLAKAIVMIRDA